MLHAVELKKLIHTVDLLQNLSLNVELSRLLFLQDLVGRREGRKGRNLNVDQLLACLRLVCASLIDVHVACKMDLKASLGVGLAHGRFGHAAQLEFSLSKQVFHLFGSTVMKVDQGIVAKGNQSFSSFFGFSRYFFNPGELVGFYFRAQVDPDGGAGPIFRGWIACIRSRTVRIAV